MIAKTLLASVAIMLLASVNAEYDVAKYCQLVKPGTKLPSMTSCQTYYLCGPNNQPMKANCDNTSVFNKDTQTCVPEGQGNCYFDLANPCENKNKQFVPNTQHCNQWHYCENGNIAGTGSCQPGQIFSAFTSSCIYGSCEGGNNNDGFTPVQNMCDIMPNGQFFGDFKNCNGWHKCTVAKKVDGNCLDNLVFDTKTGMCLQNDGTMCDRTNGVDSTSLKPKSACTAETTVKKLGDLNICSVYYECQLNSNGAEPGSYQWVEQKCPYNQYFDVISNTCASRSSARTFTGCNRCEFTTGSTYWINDVDPKCTAYSTCRNGQKLANGNKDCGVGNYFNEAAQYCILGTTNLDDYTKNNGACQGYTCDKTNRICTVTPQNPPSPQIPSEPQNPADPKNPSDPTQGNSSDQKTPATKTH